MYRLYLSQENSGLTLRLPVLPEYIEIKTDVDNNSYTILQFGEVIRPGDRKLKSLDIKSYFPATDSPQNCVFMINKMIENKSPIRFSVNRIDRGNVLFDSNLDVVIDSFTYKENGGEVGDIYFSLKLTEFRKFSAKVI